MKDLLSKSAKVIELYPSLGYEGFRHRCDQFFDKEDWGNQQTKLLEHQGQFEIQTTISYFIHKSADRVVFSGSLKHSAEAWGAGLGLATYVSNGSAILGAILSGYTPEIIYDSSRCYLHWLPIYTHEGLSFSSFAQEGRQ